MPQQHRSSPAVLDHRTLSRDHRRLAELLRPGLSVLDIGCGTGAITSGVAEAVQPSGAALGMDRDPEHIARAVERFAGQPGLSFVCGDVLTLTAEDHFDVVTAARTLQWVPRLDEALARMARAAKPGGTVLVLDYSHERLRWSPEPPASMARFYAAFLAWRAGLGMDNTLGETLAARFDACGLRDVHVTNQDEIARRGDPGFDGAVDLWLHVIHSCGPAMIAAGALTEAESDAAERDYQAFCRGAAERQHVVLRGVEGTRP
ncbi:methyltransferase domain-containing protein [Sorangium cellulosum]|uniref:methyltransferase domain-containing protein n=1 Tax=Sorangium cellulosum TaxID=56 RepID=UPI000CF426A6|nr:methyltransferase domain-containing protein [Sorangium cellulosum]